MVRSKSNDAVTPLDPVLAKQIRLVAFDVDGVMTDAGVFMGVAGPHRIELKKFSTQDSVGIKLLMATGITVAVVSGRVSEATSIRARELGIEEVVQVADARKIPPFKALLKRLGVEFEEVAFVGDDLPDVPVMRLVALPVGVGNAVPEVLELARFSTERSGGNGAVREFAEALLKARGEWDYAVTDYLDGRGDSLPAVRDVT
jgi:3-deoxy-D-manno-octulosonate 8-phosphate phosphatase (KDO 8-P phosphatase)